MLKRRSPSTSKVVIIFIVLYAIIFFLVPITVEIWSGFARACNKLEVGMSKESVLVVMKEYQNSKGFTFYEKANEVSYVADRETYTADTYQCIVLLDQEGNVSSILPIFD